jgi:hypothetical protein
MPTLFRSLLLTSLCMLFIVAVGNAQAPATTPQDVPATTAEFLATLAGDQGDQSDAPEIESLLPTPKFLSTTCTSDAQCPTGQKCCYPCGIPDCDFVCMDAPRNRCPFFP